MNQVQTPKNTARPVTPLGIATQQLKQVIEAAKQAQVSPSLVAALDQVADLIGGIDPYLSECTTKESSALAALAQRTADEDWSQRFSDGETLRQLEQEMLSGHIEGQILKLFISMLQAKSVLEVGMFTGYSALAMAEALPPDGRLVACEVDAYVADLARDCFKASEHGYKISVKVAPALETLRELADKGESFDLVFIDADKKEYIDYFNLLLDAELVRTGGIIAVDNTLLQGQVYLNAERRSPNGEAIAQFNRRVAEDPRVEQVLLPLRDGLTVIRRK